MQWYKLHQWKQDNSQLSRTEWMVLGGNYLHSWSNLLEISILNLNIVSLSLADLNVPASWCFCSTVIKWWCHPRTLKPLFCNLSPRCIAWSIGLRHDSWNQLCIRALTQNSLKLISIYSNGLLIRPSMQQCCLKFRLRVALCSVLFSVCHESMRLEFNHNETLKLRISKVLGSEAFSFWRMKKIWFSNCISLLFSAVVQ